MDILIPLSPLLAVLALAFVAPARRGPCPDCGARLPAFVSPSRKTRRMWWAGGCFCERCGCETDAAGRKAAADAPVPATAVRAALVAAVLLAGGGVLLGATFLVPRVPAAPPAVAAPQQVPPAPPAVVAPQPAPPAPPAP